MIETRFAEKQDLNELARLFDLYRVFYQQPSDRDKAYRFLEERMTLNESTIICAVDQHQIAGFTQLFPSFSSVSARRLWVLNDLYVDQPYRRRGVASLLLKSACDFAAQQGAVRVCLETDISNGSAQRLYEQQGWIRNNETYHYHFELE